MTLMTRMELRRIFQQRLVYFFLALFVLAVIAYSGLLTTAELRPLVDADERVLGGSYFPEFMLRFYSTNVGALFMAIITALYICEDRQAGLLVQPLLHGRTKKEVLDAKIGMLCLFSFVMVAAIALIVYIVTFFRWGGEMLTTPILAQSLSKYALVALSFLPLELFLILLACYAKQTLIVVGETFLFLMLLGFLNQEVPQAARFFPLYYPYEWVIKHEYRSLQLAEIWPGLLIFLLYSVLLYLLIISRRNKITFDR